MEAILHGLETGYLPLSKGERKGRYYFTPVTTNCENSPYNISHNGRQNKRQAIRSANIYAEMRARQYFMEKELGSVPWWYLSAVDTKPNFRAWFTEEEGFSEERAREFVDALWERRGVILEPNEKIFSFRRRKDPGIHAIRVYCHEGLPIDCVKGIRILGKAEKELTKEFIEHSR